MELERQVVSLELAKKLKELGVKQESYFKWQFSYNGGDVKMWNIFPFFHSEINGSPNVTAAFTVAELGEMLNNVGAEKFIKSYGEVFNFKGTQMVGLLGVINLMRLPDMGAKMLIYLLENKLI